MLSIWSYSPSSKSWGNFPKENMPFSHITEQLPTKQYPASFDSPPLPCRQTLFSQLSLLSWLLSLHSVLILTTFLFHFSLSKLLLLPLFNLITYNLKSFHLHLIISIFRLLFMLFLPNSFFVLSHCFLPSNSPGFHFLFTILTILSHFFPTTFPPLL